MLILPPLTASPATKSTVNQLLQNSSSTATESPIRPAYQRVTDEMRRQICTGVYKVGGKIPPLKTLASHFNITTQTVHRALIPLIDEGLLESRHGSGVYVLRTRAVVDSIAIYVGGNLSPSPAKLYRWTLYELLDRMLAAKAIKSRLFTEMREPDYCCDAPPELIEQIKTRQVQGVIILSRNKSAMQWINQLKLPWVVFTPESIPHKVGADSTQEGLLVAKVIAQRGCQQPTVISTRRSDNFNDIKLNYFTHLQQCFESYAINLPLERIYQPPAYRDIETEAAKYGYTTFRQLWSQTDRPDALFVDSDVAARGVAMAMAELGIYPTQSLLTVFHRNKDIELLAPFPYVAVELDIQSCAEAALTSLEMQLAGQPAQPILVPYVVIENSQ